MLKFAQCSENINPNGGFSLGIVAEYHEGICLGQHIDIQRGCLVKEQIAIGEGQNPDQKQKQDAE